jgi:hypothetical protein
MDQCIFEKGPLKNYYKIKTQQTSKNIYKAANVTNILKRRRRRRRQQQQQQKQQQQQQQQQRDKYTHIFGPFEQWY